MEMVIEVNMIEDKTYQKEWRKVILAVRLDIPCSQDTEWSWNHQ